LLKPEVVFLDFGGTIARQTNTREEAIAASLSMLGHSRPLPDIAAAVTAAREKYSGQWKGAMSVQQRGEFFSGLYAAAARALGFGADSRAVGRHLWDTQQDSYELYPEVMTALRLLRESGVRLGIISNWDKLNLTDVCRDLGSLVRQRRPPVMHETLPDEVRVNSDSAGNRIPLIHETSVGITQWFDVILPSAQAEADKPDPRIFRLALEMAHADAQSCVHVGDSYGADVMGARGVGMIGILVQRGGSSNFDCPTVGGLDEVPSLLARL
jgi:FMN phosphatase YigB (HAD superfamily)